MSGTGTSRFCGSLIPRACSIALMRAKCSRGRALPTSLMPRLPMSSPKRASSPPDRLRNLQVQEYFLPRPAKNISLAEPSPSLADLLYGLKDCLRLECICNAASVPALFGLCVVSLKAYPALSACSSPSLTAEIRGLKSLQVRLLLTIAAEYSQQSGHLIQLEFSKLLQSLLGHI